MFDTDIDLVPIYWVELSVMLMSNGQYYIADVTTRSSGTLYGWKIECLFVYSVMNKQPYVLLAEVTTQYWINVGNFSTFYIRNETIERSRNAIHTFSQTVQCIYRIKGPLTAYKSQLDKRRTKTN